MPNILRKHYSKNIHLSVQLANAYWVSYVTKARSNYPGPEVLKRYTPIPPADT